MKTNGFAGLYLIINIRLTCTIITNENNSQMGDLSSSLFALGYLLSNFSLDIR
jgi:hypothetical protein